MERSARRALATALSGGIGFAIIGLLVVPLASTLFVPTVQESSTDHLYRHMADLQSFARAVNTTVLIASFLSGACFLWAFVAWARAFVGPAELNANSH